MLQIEIKHHKLNYQFSKIQKLENRLKDLENLKLAMMERKQLFQLNYAASVKFIDP